MYCISVSCTYFSPTSSIRKTAIKHKDLSYPSSSRRGLCVNSINDKNSFNLLSVDINVCYLFGLENLLMQHKDEAIRLPKKLHSINSHEVSFCDEAVMLLSCILTSLQSSE